MTPWTRLPGIAVLALVSQNLTYLKPKTKETSVAHGADATWLVSVYLPGQTDAGCTFTAITRLVSLHACKHRGAAPGQRTGEPRQTREVLGVKCTLFIPTHDAMGGEERTTQPNLGVWEDFLEEMVLELVSKDI